MGTRANIILRENSDEKILYSHYDGYIVDGVGEMLEEFIWDFMDSRINIGSPLIEELYERLINKMHPNPDNFDLVGAFDIAGDIEYLYIIDIKDDIPSLVAYSRISDEAWENGPSDYLNSWNFVELINTSDYVTEG